MKTIFQVGDRLTEDWRQSLGCPIEFIPLGNPYDLHPGHTLQFELLLNGNRLPDQLVYVGSAHAGPTNDGHSHDDAGGHHYHELQQYRPDANGHVSFIITHEGVRYLRTIHVVESDEQGLTHESSWATVTFAIGEGYNHLHGRQHEHAEGDDLTLGIPRYFYWVGSLILIAGLFFIYNRKSR